MLFLSMENFQILLSPFLIFSNLIDFFLAYFFLLKSIVKKIYKKNFKTLEIDKEKHKSREIFQPYNVN